MEFVSPEEVADLLDEYGIESAIDGPECVRLQMVDGEGVVHVHLATSNTACKPRPGANVVRVDKARLPKVVEH